LYFLRFYRSIVSFRDGALKVADGNFLFLATFDFWQQNLHKNDEFVEVLDRNRAPMPSPLNTLLRTSVYADRDCEAELALQICNARLKSSIVSEAW